MDRNKRGRLATSPSCNSYTTVSVGIRSTVTVVTSRLAWGSRTSPMFPSNWNSETGQSDWGHLFPLAFWSLNGRGDRSRASHFTGRIITPSLIKSLPYTVGWALSNSSFCRFQLVPSSLIHALSVRGWMHIPTWWPSFQLWINGRPSLGMNVKNKVRYYILKGRTFVNVPVT
jgi:hypothetical protein